jgi:hypothetical protein
MQLFDLLCVISRSKSCFHLFKSRCPMRRPLILTLIPCTLVLSGMSQSYVQTATNYIASTNATTIVQAFSGASTTGDLIIVHVDYGTTAVHTASVTDNKGNTYKKINNITWNGTWSAELWYAYDITGGTITVTANLSGAAGHNYTQIYISEYSAIFTTSDPLDKNATAENNTTGVSSGSVTTTYSNELIYGAGIGSSGALSTGAGFANRSTVDENIIEDKSVVSAGSYSATFSSAGGNWVAQIATFKTTMSVLPVDFSSFTGNCDNNKVVLNWTTSSEFNNDRFTIEESADGAKWDSIGTVGSQGNSGLDQNYSYTVNGMYTGGAYFRLDQVDLNGNFSYSRIIHAGDCSLAPAAVNIYPNPSNGASLGGRIDLAPGQTSMVEVFDGMGRTVGAGEITQADFTIGFPRTLPAGLYYARFSSTTGSSVTAFLVRH